MFFFFIKQKTAFELRISDWSSDVCSSDLSIMHLLIDQRIEALTHIRIEFIMDCSDQIGFHPQHRLGRHPLDYADAGDNDAPRAQLVEQSIEQNRSEEHTSELQSLMRISYAVFCLKKKKNQ